MKKVAGRLRIDLAQYRALEAFAQFGSELDKASQQQLARGARVVEVLKQPQYQPLPVERQVVAIYAATGGLPRRLPGRGREAVRRRSSASTSTRGTRRSSSAIRDTGRPVRRDRGRAEGRDRGVRGDVRADRDGARLRGRARRDHAARRGQARRRLGPHVVGRAATGHVPTREEAREEYEEKAGRPVGRRARPRVTDGRQAPRRPSADPLGPVDDEDHASDGAHRRPRASSRPSSGSSGAPVRASSSPPRWRTWPVSTGSLAHPLLEARRDPAAAGVLVVTSDRGLAGSYNSNVLKVAEGRDRGRPASRPRARRST